MKPLALVISLSVALPGVSFSQQAESCSAEQGALSALDAKYKPSYSAIEQQGESLSKQAPKDEDKVRFNVKVEMKEQKWILKLPSVTMVRNQIVLGLPQIKSSLQTISFDLPETRMERRKTGQYPQTTCSKDDWGIPYDCRTTWSNTYADVPITSMVRHEAKIDVPEVTWKDQALSWDIPQLTWVENTWVVKIPEFTVLNVAVEQGKDLQSKSNNLSQDIAKVNAARIGDSRAATQALYACFRSDMEKQQTAMEKDLEGGINSLSATIQSIRAQGADPTKVPSSGNKAIDLVATLADMVAKRKEAADSFAIARAQLDKEEKNGIGNL